MRFTFPLGQRIQQCFTGDDAVLQRQQANQQITLACNRKHDAPPARRIINNLGMKNVCRQSSPLAGVVQGAKC